MPYQVDGQTADAVAKSVAYLQGQVPAMTDVYELAITSYVLAVAGSPQAETALNMLITLATTEGRH